MSGRAAAGGAEGGAKPPARGLVINAATHTNSAALFWLHLLEDTLAAHPDCDLIELSALTSVALSPEQLFPGQALARDLRDLARANLARELHDVLAELVLLGGPAPVRVRVLGDGGRRAVSDRVMDEVDAEVLAYLVAWLLEWSGVPYARWNDARVESGLRADDARQGWHYSLSYALTHAELSEGLLERRLLLAATRERGA